MSKTRSSKVVSKSTFRESAAKKRAQAAKPKRIKKTARGVAAPFKFLARLIKKLVRPLGVLLRPFKARPFRFIGRLLSKIFLLTYFRQSWKELRSVEWPNRKETTKLTIAVFVFATVFGFAITGVDWVLDALFKNILLK